ncbi:MAG: hypothetical protein ABIJ52_05800 [Pseudomonadota bacterium]
MKDDIEQIAHMFTMAEWKYVPLSHDMKKSGLNGIFVCGYAAVGVVIVGGTSDVVSCWTDCQIQMSDLRKNKDIGIKKDLYLIFIVPDIEVSELKDLQTIINDTHVCRKICIERKGRSLEEALMDTPFLKVVGQPKKTDTKAPEATVDLSAYGMPHHLLDDLSSRSPGTILDRFLAGKYKEEEKSDEN